MLADMNAHSTEIDDTHDDALPAPNHHATHPGFSGVRGLMAAVLFLVARGQAAQLAIELSRLRRAIDSSTSAAAREWPSTGRE